MPSVTFHSLVRRLAGSAGEWLKWSRFRYVYYLEERAIESGSAMWTEIDSVMGKCSVYVGRCVDSCCLAAYERYVCGTSYEFLKARDSKEFPMPRANEFHILQIDRASSGKKCIRLGRFGEKVYGKKRWPSGRAAKKRRHESTQIDLPFWHEISSFESVEDHAYPACYAAGSHMNLLLSSCKLAWHIEIIIINE